MYPIHDIDAQLLLATLLASKRRPADLVEIVAAAEFLGCPVAAPALWANALRRFSVEGLVVAAEGGFTLTAAAQAMAKGLPKKADTAEHVFLVREKLVAHRPAEKRPALDIEATAFEAALLTHAAVSRQGGKNLLMPKPKPDEDELRRRRPARRPFAGGRRRP